MKVIPVRQCCEVSDEHFARTTGYVMENLHDRPSFAES